MFLTRILEQTQSSGGVMPLFGEIIPNVGVTIMSPVEGGGIKITKLKKSLHRFYCRRTVKDK